MKTFTFYFNVFCIVSTLCLVSSVNAQNSATEENTSLGNAVTEEAATENTLPPAEEIKAAPVVEKGAKKMVRDATINLQTTVTGNSEQPRVLYILPWQSPAPEDVDFESFSNDQRVVFGHIEREELRREIESSGEE